MKVIADVQSSPWTPESLESGILTWVWEELWVESCVRAAVKTPPLLPPSWQLSGTLRPSSVGREVQSC